MWHGGKRKWKENENQVSCTTFKEMLLQITHFIVNMHVFITKSNSYPGIMLNTLTMPDINQTNISKI